MMQDPGLVRRGVRRCAVLALMLAAACGSDDGPTAPAPLTVGAPRQLAVSYRWVFTGWNAEGAPVGYPAVDVQWALPEGWTDETFRVYARASGNATYLPIAMVTSCRSGQCVYTDINVNPGRSYDYYVVAVDPEGEREGPSPTPVAVPVPPTSIPPAPSDVEAVALDGAVYLRWASVGVPNYVVYLERVDGAEKLFQIGQTDGGGYLDTRAANDTTYGYSIASVDEQGHWSARSPLAFATPRPDFTAELLYAAGDSLAASGFQFVVSGEENAVVAGNSPAASWRLEYRRDTEQWMIQPLGGTQVTAEGTLTTALACGPGSDAGCVAVTQAPETGYTASAIEVAPELTYVFRVPAENGGVRYGKIRVTALGRGTEQAIPLMIFDWAYQLRVGERQLSRAAN